MLSSTNGNYHRANFIPSRSTYLITIITCNKNNTNPKTWEAAPLNPRPSTIQTHSLTSLFKRTFNKISGLISLTHTKKTLPINPSWPKASPSNSSKNSKITKLPMDGPSPEPSTLEPFTLIHSSAATPVTSSLTMTSRSSSTQSSKDATLDSRWMVA